MLDSSSCLFCLSVNTSDYMSSFRPFTLTCSPPPHLSVCPSIHMAGHIFIHVCLSFHLSIIPSVCPSSHPMFICLVCLLIHVCMSVSHSSLCLFCLSVCSSSIRPMFICLVCLPYLSAFSVCLPFLSVCLVCLFAWSLIFCWSVCSSLCSESINMEW